MPRLNQTAPGFAIAPLHTVLPQPSLAMPHRCRALLCPTTAAPYFAMPLLCPDSLHHATAALRPALPWLNQTVPAPFSARPYCAIALRHTNTLRFALAAPSSATGLLNCAAPMPRWRCVALPALNSSMPMTCYDSPLHGLALPMRRLTGHCLSHAHHCSA